MRFTKANKQHTYHRILSMPAIVIDVGFDFCPFTFETGCLLLFQVIYLVTKLENYLVKLLPNFHLAFAIFDASSNTFFFFQIEMSMAFTKIVNTLKNIQSKPYHTHQMKSNNLRLIIFLLKFVRDLELRGQIFVDKLAECEWHLFKSYSTIPRSVTWTDGGWLWGCFEMNTKPLMPFRWFFFFFFGIH